MSGLDSSMTPRDASQRPAETPQDASQRPGGTPRDASQRPGGTPRDASQRPAGAPAAGRISRIAIHVCMTASATLFSFLATTRYRACLSDWAFDLAYFHNLVANAASGYGFVQSASTHELDGLLNLSHATFLLPLVVPFYWLVPRVETLLVLQSLALASGMYPVARLARASGASPATATAAALLYAASFPLWRLGLTDFRPLIFSVPALLWLAVGLATRSTWLTLGAAFLACLAREEVAILVAALAACSWLLRGTDRKRALAAIGLAILYFLAQLWIRPQAGFYIPFDRPGTLLESFTLDVPGGFSRASQLNHLAAYWPAGFWPGVLEPAILLGAIPLLGYQLFFSTYEWWTWQGPYVHHMAPLLAFTAGAAAAGWGRLETFLRRRWPRGARLVPVFAVIAMAVQVPGSVQRLSRTMGWQEGTADLERRQQRMAEVESLLLLIPPDARVATDYRLIGRLSGRRWLYCYQSSFLVDPSESRGTGPGLPGLAQVGWMLVNAAHEDWVELLEQKPGWRLLDSRGGYRLYFRVGGTVPVPTGPPRG